MNAELIMDKVRQSQKEQKRVIVQWNPIRNVPSDEIVESWYVCITNDTEHDSKFKGRHRELVPVDSVTDAVKICKDLFKILGGDPDSVKLEPTLQKTKPLFIDIYIRYSTN